MACASNISIAGTVIETCPVFIHAHILPVFVGLLLTICLLFTKEANTTIFGTHAIFGVTFVNFARYQNTICTLVAQNGIFSCYWALLWYLYTCLTLSHFISKISLAVKAT